MALYLPLAEGEMTQALTKITWTIHDLAVLPENPTLQYEIIAGELLVTRTPHYRHQYVCLQIAAALNTWSQETGQGITLISPGLLYSESDSVIPDVVWVSGERLAQIEDESGHLTASPELVIEVLSPGKENQRRDREAKLKLYSVQGVLEYWLLDRFKRQVEVYRRQQGQLQLAATLRERDQMTTPLLPDFATVVESLWGHETH